MRIVGYVATWVVVAALASALAFGALSSADRQVGDGPLTPVLTPEAGGGATTAAPTTGPPTTSSAIPATSPTSTSSPTSTTTSTTTTSTSVPPPSPSPPSTIDGWTTATVPTGGGVIVVAHRPGEVRLESATPAPGYVMEIDKTGPDDVRVEFEGQTDSYRVRVRWRGDLLETDVDHDD